MEVALTIMAITQLLSLGAIGTLGWWGMKNRLVAGEAEAQIKPRAKKLAELTIKEFIQRTVDTAEKNKSLTGAEKKGYVERQAKRRFKVDPKELDTLIEEEVAT